MDTFAVVLGATTIRGTALGEGSPVVFLHAGVADRRSWFEVMNILGDRGMRCIAYDQRGYGDTKSSGDAFSHRGDLAAVLDQLELDHVVLVGSSRGGQIAVDFTLAAPDRVAALMLIGSSPADAPFPPPPDVVKDLFRAIEQAEEKGDLASVNELEARVWLDGPLAAPQRVGSALRELFLDMNGRALAAAPCGTADPFAPTWDALPAVRVPVSILVGGFDMPGLVAAAKATADRIPNAQFRLVPDTAHLPMLEQPLLIADEIADLIDRVPGQPR